MASVRSAIADANAAGETPGGHLVTVPAGACEWAEPLGNVGAITYGAVSLTVQGAGGGDPATSGNPATDTIITDNSVGATVRIDAIDGKSYRLTGFRINRGTTTKTGAATIQVTGVTHALRIDSNILDYRTGSGAVRSMFIGEGTSTADAYITGVVSGNTIFPNNGDNGEINVYNAGGKPDSTGAAAQWGDGAWTLPADWGSDDFLFIEDNTFDGRITEAFAGSVIPVIDGEYSRLVIRYNTYYCNENSMAVHGTESGGRARAFRAIENYGNIIDTVTNCKSGGNGPGQQRGGGFMAFDNVFTASGAPDLWPIRSNRSNQSFQRWLSSDGSNAFDLNDGTVYASGTADSVVQTTQLCSITVSPSPGWGDDQWALLGASIRNTTVGEGSAITGNDADTIEYNGGSGTSGSPCGTPFSVGNAFQILRAIKLFDAVGRGAGRRLTINNPPRLPDGTIQTTPDYGSWIEQEDELSYQFNNTWNGSIGQMDIQYETSFGSGTMANIPRTPHVLENRDVMQHATAFNGTLACSSYPHCGVGYGTRAERNTAVSGQTLANGVAWWATDAGGDWNSETPAVNDGCLDVVVDGAFVDCDYTPFRYPYTLSDADAPELFTAVPDEGTRTSCAVSCEVVLTGTGFSEANFTGNISGADVSIMCTDDSDTMATCDVAVENDAATGLRQISVTTDGGTSTSVDFRILAPIIDSVSPPAVSQDVDDQLITLTGSTFDGASETVTFDPSDGLTVVMIGCTSGTCTFFLDVTADATPGVRTLTLETFDGIANTNFNIEIVATGSPVITNIAPGSGYLATIMPMNFIGVGLTGGTLVENCDGLSFAGTSVASDTLITTLATLVSDADLSTCNIYVQNGEELSFVNGAGARANTVAIPTTAVGDLMLMAAFGPVTGGCTIPSGWTAVDPDSPWATTTSWSMGMFWKVATTTSESSGTWTSCTRLAVTVHRNPHGVPLGNYTRTQNLSDAVTAITYSATAFQVVNTTSWAVACTVHSDSTPGPQTPPTGMTLRADSGAGSGGRIACHDTNGAVTGWSAQTVTAGASSKNATVVVEVKANASNPIPFTPLVIPGGPVGPLRAR